MSFQEHLVKGHLQFINLNVVRKSPRVTGFDWSKRLTDSIRDITEAMLKEYYHIKSTTDSSIWIPGWTVIPKKALLHGLPYNGLQSDPREKNERFFASAERSEPEGVFHQKVSRRKLMAHILKHSCGEEKELTLSERIHALQLK